MAYRSTKEIAAEIRTKYKNDHGWNRNHVSVKIDLYSMGSSIDVTIKSADVDFAVAKEIAESYQEIRYCEASQEILSGGNMYVHVGFDTGKIVASFPEHLAKLTEIAETFPATFERSINDNPFYDLPDWFGSDSVSFHPEDPWRGRLVKFPKERGCGENISTGISAERDRFPSSVIGALWERGILKTEKPTPDNDETKPQAKSTEIVTGKFNAPEKHHNERRGFDYYLVTTTDRLTSNQYIAELARAKSTGGWYSRAWKGTPGGFAFKCAIKAAKFSGHTLETGKHTIDNDTAAGIVLGQVETALAAESIEEPVLDAQTVTECAPKGAVKEGTVFTIEPSPAPISFPCSDVLTETVILEDTGKTTKLAEGHTGEFPTGYLVKDTGKKYTRQKVDELKEAGQDFEFYPTTGEIRRALWFDVYDRAKSLSHKNRNYQAGEIRINENYHSASADTLKIGSFLDVGTGDGRVILDPVGLPGKMKAEIEHKMGVEKSTIHADKLVADGVWLLGRDYMTMTLVDKTLDVVYCNPPYSAYKEWTKKLIAEANAEYIYLCIPSRWKTDPELVKAANAKGTVDTVGYFDFSQGDREARANVDLICITKNKETSDPFKDWVEEHIGEFKANPTPDFSAEKETGENSEDVGTVAGIAEQLVNKYDSEMGKMLANYRRLASMDFALLEQLGVSCGDVLARIKKTIEELKASAWKEAIGKIDTFRNRLTYKTGADIVSRIDRFSSLDFNLDNIRNVAIWVVENFNEYSRKQLEKCYDDLTYFGDVKAYKSNVHWTKDTWRYEKCSDSRGMPEQNMLDYRVVTSGCSLSRYNFAVDARGYHPGFGGYHDKADNLVSDLCIVISSLGYDVDPEVRDIVRGKNQDVYTTDGKILAFSFKAYKNGNLHFKINTEILRKLNIEVGKLKGWIKEPSDIETEFNATPEEAVELFGQTSLQLLAPQNIKLLS